MVIIKFIYFVIKYLSAVPEKRLIHFHEHNRIIHELL